MRTFRELELEQELVQWQEFKQAYLLNADSWHHEMIQAYSRRELELRKRIHQLEQELNDARFESNHSISRVPRVLDIAPMETIQVPVRAKLRVGFDKDQFAAHVITKYIDSKNHMLAADYHIHIGALREIPVASMFDFLFQTCWMNIIEILKGKKADEPINNE